METRGMAAMLEICWSYLMYTIGRLLRIEAHAIYGNIDEKKHETQAKKTILDSKKKLILVVRLSNLWACQVVGRKF